MKTFPSPDTFSLPPFHTTGSAGMSYFYRCSSESKPPPRLRPFLPRYSHYRRCIYLFGVLRRFQHCTGHIATGSWKGRGNQCIQFVRVLYCKLPTNGKQLPAFPLEAVRGSNPGLRGGRRECYHSATVAPTGGVIHSYRHFECPCPSTTIQDSYLTLCHSGDTVTQCTATCLMLLYYTER